MPSVKELYLIAYNAACAVGWAYVFYLTLTALQRGEGAGALWRSVREPLTLVQSAAALEVAHALLGLVSSPALTVAMQVSSRLILLWCYSRAFAARCVWRRAAQACFPGALPPRQGCILAALTPSPAPSAPPCAPRPLLPPCLPPPPSPQPARPSHGPP